MIPKQIILQRDMHISQQLTALKMQSFAITINATGSTMMSSSPSQDVREPMMKERGTTLTKPVLNTSLLDGWLKEQ